jgi:hypothetical protein
MVAKEIRHAKSATGAAYHANRSRVGGIREHGDLRPGRRFEIGVGTFVVSARVPARMSMVASSANVLPGYTGIGALRQGEAAAKAAVATLPYVVAAAPSRALAGAAPATVRRPTANTVGVSSRPLSVRCIAGVTSAEKSWIGCAQGRCP